MGRQCSRKEKQLLIRATDSKNLSSYTGHHWHVLERLSNISPTNTKLRIRLGPVFSTRLSALFDAEKGNYIWESKEVGRCECYADQVMKHKKDWEKVT